MYIVCMCVCICKHVTVAIQVRGSVYIHKFIHILKS